MAIELQERAGGKVLQVRVTGKLDREAYDQFLPEVERLIRQFGKVRVLFEMHDFHGWAAGALWEDVKFDAKHFNDIERIAMVGETAWQKGMAAFCKPFTTATVRYFEPGEADMARAWLEEDL